jgi:hypothetical protein
LAVFKRKITFKLNLKMTSTQNEAIPKGCKYRTDEEARLANIEQTKERNRINKEYQREYQREYQKEYQREFRKKKS